MSISVFLKKLYLIISVLYQNDRWMFDIHEVIYLNVSECNELLIIFYEEIFRYQKMFITQRDYFTLKCIIINNFLLLLFLLILALLGLF